MAISATMRQDIMELAVLMNNKAPGTKLLGELVAEANAGKTLTEIAGTLAARAEFIKEYPAHQTASEFGAEWIANILPEASAALQTECVAIVEASINAGTSLAALVVSVQDFMSKASESDAALGTHIKNFNNKVTVATYHTITQEAEAEWAIPATVTSDATTVTTANSAVDTALAPVVVAEAAKSLVMQTASESVVGGTADDNISAVYSNTAGALTGSTILPGDTIDGGAGTDTLTISTSGAPGGAMTLAAIQSKDVENIMFNAYDTTDGANGTVLDMTLFTGVEKVGVSSGSATGDLHFNNIGNLVDLSMSNSSGDVTLTYDAGVVLGAGHTQKIALSNNTNGAFAIAGIETFDITSSLLSNTVASLASSSMTNVIASGANNLTITTALDFKDSASKALGAAEANIDASNLTGKLSVGVNALDNSNITGGSGNDTFVMGAGMNGFDKIDGGDGTDTITMNLAAFSTQFAQTTNVEVVSINPAGTAAGIDASKFTGSTIVLDLNDTTGGGSSTTDSTVTSADGKTIVLAKTAADAADANNNDGSQVTITNAVDTSADTVNLQLNNVGTYTSANNGYAVVDVATYETVNITANANATGTNALNQVAALTATAATSVTVTGTGALTTVLSGAKVTSFDASGLAGALSLTPGGNGTNTTTYKMGGKSSTLTMAGNLDNKTIIEGGAGTADTVTATVSGLSALTGTSALSIKDVENITLVTSGANTLGLAGSSAYKTVTVTDNKQTITGFDLGATIALGSATDAADTASEIDVTATDATGAADNLSVKVFNNGGGVTSIIDVAAAVETATFTTQAATNTVTLDMTTAEVASIVLAEKAATNSGTIALGTLHKNTTSVSSTADAPVTVAFNQASAVTGSAVTFTGKGTGVQNVTGGALGDTVTIGSTGNIIHVVSGGGGTDTTNITTAAAFVNAGSIDTESLNITVANGADVSLSGATFNSGVDNVAITGGNSLSTFTTGTIHTNLKTVDMSGFAGNGAFTLADDAADATVTLTGGPLATDTLTYGVTATGTDTPQTAGIETIAWTTTATATLDMSKSDASLVTLDVAAAKTATLDKAESTTLRVVNASADSVIEVKLADSTGSADAVTIELKDAASNIVNDHNIKTTDIETVTIKASSAEQSDLSQLSMATAGKTMALNVTGTSGLTISALNADVVSIDASTKLAGGVVQTARSSTAVADYKGGAGADTFIMSKMGDTLSGGAGVDTLDINFAAVLGGINVDLSSTTNQIVSANGAAITGSVLGFESVALDGYTGTFGAMITAAATGSTMTGTANADQINGGAKADTVVAQTGTNSKDVVVLGAGNDTVQITQASLADKSAGTNTSTYTFGDGTGDVLQMTDAGAIVDADLIQMTGVEILTLPNGTNTVVHATNGIAAGIVTINGGTGADTVTTGIGAQTVNFGTGTDVLKVSAAGESAVFASTTATFVSTTGMDIITGLVAGDDVNLAGYTGTAQATAANVKLDNAGYTIKGNDLTVTLVDNDVFVVRGTYSSAADTFTEGGAGADALFIYDANVAAAAQTYNAVVLVGTGANSFAIPAAAGGTIDIS